MVKYKKLKKNSKKFIASIIAKKIVNSFLDIKKRLKLTMELNTSELKKYSRQLILKNIGIPGQKKIFNSKILVIGAGGLGCPLMLYLAYSGVGNLGIVDNDKIEISNLSRQVLFTKKDLGKFKVTISKKFIKKINKKIKLKPI